MKTKVLNVTKEQFEKIQKIMDEKKALNLRIKAAKLAKG